jgi:pimeloyl-[acyl-carrier protein] synthase
MEPITDMNKELISPGKTKKTGAAKAFKFNPFDPEFHVNPYPIYHRLRSEEPICWTFPGVWVLTRYADVKVVMSDPRFCTNKLSKWIKDKDYYLQQQGELNTLAQASSKFFFFMDPPDHTRLRGLVSKAFSPAVVERMRTKIQEIVNKLIGLVWDKGSMDIISDLACPLPIIVIARMLGVPDEDHSKLHQWSNDLSRILDPLSLEAYKHLNKVAVEFTEYFRGLIAEREKSPKEDLLSALVAVREHGDKLSEEELVSICVMLFVTGFDTPVHLIGNGMLALLRHPDQMEKLKREPAIIQSAIEELLRYDTPVQQIARMATENVEIGGKTIRSGERVILCPGAANRDPAQFTDPNKLDIARAENCHLAFSSGIHYCLGAALARVQGQIAINTLVQRLPDLKLHTDILEWREHIAIRGLKALPVTFTP